MNKISGFKSIKTTRERIMLTDIGLKLRAGPKWVMRVLALVSFTAAALIRRDDATPELRLVWELSALVCFFVMGVYFAAFLPVWTRD